MNSLNCFHYGAAGYPENNKLPMASSVTEQTLFLEQKEEEKTKLCTLFKIELIKIRGNNMDQNI